MSVLESSSRAEKVSAWLAGVAQRQDPSGKAFLNREQLDFVRTVAARVTEEENTGEAENLRHRSPAEPLRLIRTELFDGVLEWQQGRQYKVVALQAVMAEQLEGDAIHHAVGLNKRGEETGIGFKRLAELTAAATQWRWLLLDELSVVSAELLARLELRCRELVRDASQQKYAAGCTTARPFGGLNVLSGDLWQLAPPRGTFLGAIPAQMLRSKGVSTKLPHAAYGQQLIWGGPKNGIQGVTELVTCERTQDGCERCKKSSDTDSCQRLAARKTAQNLRRSTQTQHDPARRMQKVSRRAALEGTRRHDRERSALPKRIPGGDLYFRHQQRREIPREP